MAYKVTIYMSNGDRIIHLAEDMKKAVQWSSEFTKDGELVGFSVYKINNKENKEE